MQACVRACVHACVCACVCACACALSISSCIVPHVGCLWSEFLWPHEPALCLEVVQDGIVVAEPPFLSVKYHLVILRRVVGENAHPVHILRHRTHNLNRPKHQEKKGGRKEGREGGREEGAAFANQNKTPPQTACWD